MARNPAKIEWAGVKELKRTLEEAGLKLDDRDPRLKEVLLVPCQKAMGRAQALAPKRTGYLAENLYANKGSAKLRGILMGVRKKVKYAGYVEFGTSRTPPHPFFRPAMIEMHSYYVNDIAAGVKKIIEDSLAETAYKPPT
jgi:HK97 gp10 family phage protein